MDLTFENCFSTIIPVLPAWGNYKERLEDAFLFGKNAHEWQKRKTGEPYFVHPIAVSKMLWERYQDIELTIAGLLHDTIEDCADVSEKDIYDRFGQDVGFMVDSATKTTNCYYQSDICFDDKVEKFLYGGMRDIRCFILKLGDREDNLKTLRELKPNKQMRMTFETQAIYQPLRDALGIRDGLSLKEAYNQFHQFLKREHITDVSALKQNLLNHSFHDLDKESFKSIYKNSQNVVWEMEDKDLFKQLMSTDLEKDIKILSLEQWQNDRFRALFQYNTPIIDTQIVGKIKVGSLRSI